VVPCLVSSESGSPRGFMRHPCAMSVVSLGALLVGNELWSALRGAGASWLVAASSSSRAHRTRPPLPRVSDQDPQPHTASGLSSSACCRHAAPRKNSRYRLYDTHRPTAYTEVTEVISFRESSELIPTLHAERHPSASPRARAAARRCSSSEWTYVHRVNPGSA